MAFRKAYRGAFRKAFVGQLGANLNQDPAFKITVDTTKTGSASDTFILPTSGAGFDADIDWGDGGAVQNILGTPGNVSHTYTSSGTYQISITGLFPRIYFNNLGDKLKLITIDNWGDIIWATLLNAFYGCSNMSGSYNDSPDLSATSSLWGMFRDCTLFNSSVSNFDTSTISSLTSMFFACTSFKQSLASFDITSVTSAATIAAACDINETGTTTNYDNTLISWASQSVTPSINTNFGTSKYSAAGKVARDILTGVPNNWTITDGGEA